MIRKIYGVLAICSLVLVACGESNHSDLEEFILKSGEGLQGQVDPIEEVKAHEHFVYNAFDLDSPFEPRKRDLAKKKNNGLQPDLERLKEILENFPLESIKMVGSLEQDKNISALLTTPDNILHRVTIGNYLGHDFGKISAILDSKITINEIVQDGVEEWTERVRTLMLEDQG